MVGLSSHLFLLPLRADHPPDPLRLAPVDSFWEAELSAGAPS